MNRVIQLNALDLLIPFPLCTNNYVHTVDIAIGTRVIRIFHLVVLVVLFPKALQAPECSWTLPLALQASTSPLNSQIDTELSNILLAMHISSEHLCITIETYGRQVKGIRALT